MPQKIKRFEKLREYHKQIEDQLFMEFEKVQCEYEKQSEKLNEIKSKIFDLYNMEHKHFNLYEMNNVFQYKELLEKNEKQQKNVVDRQSRVVHLAKQKLVEQKIQVKKFETLIDNRKQMLQKMYLEREQKQLDEFAQLV